MKRHKGVSSIYAMCVMVLFTAFCSLGVDYGRVQIAKTELRRAADSAARAGAAGIVTDQSEATRLAQLYASNNKVDGTPFALDAAQDFRFVKWNQATGTYTIPPDFSTVNAIWVTARRSPARGTGLPMFFTSFLGIKSFNITADSVAMVIPPVNVNQAIAAVSNPFLAGMPAGSVASVNNPHHSPDYAGSPGNWKQSPLAINMPINPGDGLTFDSISGLAQHDPNLSAYQPDGDLSDIGHNNPTPNTSNNYSTTFYNENGIADMIAPINALVGVFLDDNAPNTTQAPKNLDFSTVASRDFSVLKPELKQIFFIGDGVDSSGNAQQFIAPKGATRLYLATWDFYEWNNNSGSRTILVNRPMRIITVK